MDKISNRLKLVRSQSMGVGMGVNNDKISMAAAAARRTTHSNQNHAHGDNQTTNGPSGAHSNSSGNTMNAGRNASIILLDERRLEMVIQPRLYAGELLDLIASHCQLKEKEFFGLAFVDENGTYQWLQLDRKVLDHDLPRKPVTLTVHFLVKFFIESISHLSENRTVELFFLQARSLIFRGSLEVDSEIVFQLAALALQSSFGDYIDDTQTRQLIKRSPILPASVLKERPSLTVCEDQVIENYKKTRGQTRGQAVVNYMTIVESMPTYGVHYFEVYDKRQTPWWLGLSCRGIAQYSYQDRKVPVRVFQWKQLENLYFRDKKFSIEVHDAKRVVQTVSSFNLYEDALKLDGTEEGNRKEGKKDELVDAIADSTTQVSVSRRSFNPGSIHVYVWFGKTQSLTKCIWQSAISQHQFYLDRKQAKMRHVPQRTLKEIARDLTRSSASLSSRTSSMSNLSRSGSTNSLAISASLSLGDGTIDPEQQEETRRARIEMLAALKARREALDSKIKEKNKILKELCIKEGELTGELPPEIPLAPGEQVPTIRRRVGTEFALSGKIDALLFNPEQSPEEEKLAKLELEYEIQSKITSAALKIASDTSAAKSVRKQRKTSYQQSQRKLREIESKLEQFKHLQPKHKRKQPRPPGERRSSSPDAVLMSSSRSTSIQGGVCSRIGEMLPPSQIPKRGLSVPDLDVSLRSGILDSDLHASTDVEFETSHDETDATSKASMSTSNSAASPRSCPSSPRKTAIDMSNAGKLRSKHPDSISLEASPQRNIRMVTTGSTTTTNGYIPSSVYLRSSYRTKQYPTLSTVASIGNTTRTLSVVGAGQAHADVGLPLSPADIALPGARDRSATLPSPYRNKYEVPNVQIDSPVGLYNCPQQRTSQAFSSMDDLDALATNNHHPVHHLHPNYPPQPMNAVISSPTTSSPHRHSQPHQATRGHSQSYVNHHLLNHRHILSQAQAAMSHADAACSAAIISQQPSTASLSYKGNSLERSASNAASSASRQKKFISNLSNAAANRELPALPINAGNIISNGASSKIADGSSRSMEDLDALEMTGVHGGSKMQYREIMTGSNARNIVNGNIVDGLSATRISATTCTGMPGASHTHNLPNTEEYPMHHSSSCNSTGIVSSMPSAASHRSSVSSIASASNLPGQVGVPRGYAAMPASAQAVLDQSHQHHHHHQHSVHQHNHHHRDAGGPYPALSHRNSTLLPGQTYPEPSLAKSHPGMGTLQEVFYHREMRLAAAVAANLSPTKSEQSTSHQRVSLATAPSTSYRKDVVGQSGPPPPPKQNSFIQKIGSQGGTNHTKESPPPLFPKQYHQVVEQRRRSGLDRPTATAVPPKPTPPATSTNSDLEQSPLIDRKSKPSTSVTVPAKNATANIMPTTTTTPDAPPSATSSTSTLINASTTENSVSSLSSLDATVTCNNNSTVSDSANNNIQSTQPHLPKYVPYKETTKPFEMSDFYKYSTKYRKTSASSLPRSESSGGADESSPRSSTASESSPPELPLRPTASNPGQNQTHLTGSQSNENMGIKAPLPPPPPPKTTLDIKRSSMSSNSSGSTLAPTVVSSTTTNDSNSLADAFSSEMLDWYNTQSNSSRARGASVLKSVSNSTIQQNGNQSGIVEKKNTKDSSNNKPATLV